MRRTHGRRRSGCPTAGPLAALLAVAVLGAIEAAHLLPWWLAAVAVAVALGEALMVLVLRAHYTMDVLAAAAAACCAADLAMRLCTPLGL